MLRLFEVAPAAAVAGGESIEDEDRDCSITTGEDTTGGSVDVGGGVGVAL